MWIDTHCHLDACEFGAGANDAAATALGAGVAWIVIPSVGVDNFSAVAQLAVSNSNCVYALGIHPIAVPHASLDDLVLLRERVVAALDDRRFVAIGEIGLDFFIPELITPELRAKQEHFYREQLKIARDFDLPVLLHIRRAQDMVLKHLRQIAVRGGCAHAFNGSFQQAHRFIDLGFKLGIGGAMTFSRALQIRRLASELPLSALVLETDAPDISPSWLHPAPNAPAQVAGIGAALAALRTISLSELAAATSANAYAALPRLLAAI
ncbi:MAG: TatD family hydrolase [Pseudomonadota bacterium]|nr:TatD family hydrolase [Pseudomonadota bacterium]